MDKKKNIALIAHDGRKSALLDWVKKNKIQLKTHNLFATGNTGNLITEKLKLKVKSFKSGPIGGDQQIAAAIVDGKIDMLIFFWDPLKAMPHDPDIKALLRLSTLWNIPIACNETTADFIISSKYFSGSYKKNLKFLKGYL